MTKDLTIPPEVARHLGFYVYLYIDPRSEKPFYVGKGHGQRILAHLSDPAQSRKTQVIRELNATGMKPRLEVLAHALPDEETALRIEAAAIDLLGIGELTNVARGWKSVQLGRLPLDELIAYYAAPPVKIADPVILIRINRLYRHGMSAQELYESTRGVWKIGPRREGARYALAVFQGVVKEVYEIKSWHPAGSTSYSTRSRSDLKAPGRWEFVGSPPPDPIRSTYCHRSVRKYLAKGLQSPVVYVGC